MELRQRELVSGGEGVFLMVGGASGKGHHWVNPPSGRGSVLSQALERAVEAGQMDRTVAEKACVAYYLRTPEEVEAAVEATEGLQLVEVKTAAIVIAAGESCETHAGLCWSIHSNSIAR